MCSCSYCSNKENQKPTIRIKAASSYRRERKLSELASLITGTSYPRVSFVGEKDNKTKTKGASSPDTGNLPTKLVPLERQFKLKELARLISGV
jgi:hypothetical protein